jgi:RNA polymerase sigma factor (sigma-70 family)
MTTHTMRPAVRRVAAALAIDETVATDRQLLERFADGRDESAFAQLVKRHGGMVLGVCRRVLRDAHAAEDAFQAAFLVLARKAGRPGLHDSLANWLHGVAYRTALKARTAEARRRARESAVAVRDETVIPAYDDWRPLLDRELSRLPDKYRVPVVLCELEGRPRKDVARQLKLPEGTLSSRLAAARKQLADRLARIGLAVPAAALTAELAPAAPPVSLIGSAARAAGHTAPATLTEGVFLAMTSTKIRCAAVLTAACLFGSNAVVSTRPAAVAGPEAAPAAQKKPAPEGAVVHGVVTSADAGKKTVTVAVRTDPAKKQTEERTYTLADGVKVLLNDALTKNTPPTDGTPADLTEGTQVEVRLSADGKSAVEIHARGPGVHGGVKSVDASKNTLTVLTKNKTGAVESTLELAKGAKIILDDGIGKKGDAAKEGTLADLTEGASVDVQLSVNRKSALGVTVHGATSHGTLKGFDAGTRMLTVTVKEDAQVVDKTYTLAKDAKVDGELAPGARVNVRSSVTDRAVAVAVHVLSDK